MKKTRAKKQADKIERKTKECAGDVAFRLKCARTANGLSHFVMYGDAPEGKTLL